MSLSKRNNVYNVTIRAPREKVTIIKLVRNMNPAMGLKGAKDVVEDRVQFEDWMDERVSLEVLCDDAQLGRLWFETFNDDRFEVTWMYKVEKPGFDIDLTA